MNLPQFKKRGKYKAGCRRVHRIVDKACHSKYKSQKCSLFRSKHQGTDNDRYVDNCCAGKSQRNIAQKRCERQDDNQCREKCNLYHAQGLCSVFMCCCFHAFPLLVIILVVEIQYQHSIAYLRGEFKIKFTKTAS